MGTSCEIRSMSTSYGTGASKNSPPTLAYSATTPRSRRLTSSMKAGGQDHSRPTNNPMRFVMRPPVVARRGNRAHGVEREASSAQRSATSRPASRRRRDAWRSAPGAGPWTLHAQSCPPTYFTIMRSQYGQSCAWPSQTRNAFPIPLRHRIPENSAFSS